MGKRIILGSGHLYRADFTPGTALDDPETYCNLVVRVSGWSARFKTMGRKWQQMVVERTEMGY